MRKAPYMNPLRTSTAQGNTFAGYNRQLFGTVNAFWDMRNMTGTDSPIIRTREKRRKVRTFAKCNGLFGREALGWVDGTELYYDGEKVGQVQDGKKQFVHMGAYTAIFPDKMLLNTRTMKLEQMENTVTVEGNITYTPCDKLGDSA